MCASAGSSVSRNRADLRAGRGCWSVRIRVLRGNTAKSEHVISESGPQTDETGSRIKAGR